MMLASISARQQLYKTMVLINSIPFCRGVILMARPIVPSHIHVRVRWEDENGLNDFISQLYFEGDPFLESDPWAEESRTLALEGSEGDGWTASFDFVVWSEGFSGVIMKTSLPPKTIANLRWFL